MNAAKKGQIIGTCLINQLHPTNKWGRLVGVWLLGSYPVGFMVILGLLSTNIAGSTKRSVASGWVFVCYCVGQIAGPQFFKASQKPAYHSGIVAMLCGFILNLVLNQVLRYLYVRENAKRDKMIEGKGEEELAELQNESNIKGFENTTDSQNVRGRHDSDVCSCANIGTDDVPLRLVKSIVATNTRCSQITCRRQ
jgi:hypothetical protein